MGGCAGTEKHKVNPPPNSLKAMSMNPEPPSPKNNVQQTAESPRIIKKSDIEKALDEGVIRPPVFIHPPELPSLETE